MRGYAERVHRRSLDSVTRVLVRGLDLLFVGLVAVTVAVTGGDRAPTVVAAVILLGVYAAGRVVTPSAEPAALSARGRWWPEGAWIAALFVAWIALLWISPTALWIAFPLMLLQMHVLGPHRGPGAVAATTLVAVGHAFRGGVPGWGLLGQMLGPLVGAGVAIAVVLGLEALAKESAERQRVVDELSQAREYLAEAERERAVLGERERLAREIHDTLAQGFSAVDLLLRAVRPQLDDGPAARLVDEASRTARDNLAEARRFVRALAPVDLEADTLVGALRRQVNRAAGETLTATLRVDGTPQHLPLPLEAALLRITQSALANVAQHARATRVDVTLCYAGDEVMLDIVDDGAGFDPAVAQTASANGGGFGLRGSASRVRELGGTFTIESAPGSGTALAVALPSDERSTP